jgi:predicted Zn-dependent peptidase
VLNSNKQRNRKNPNRGAIQTSTEHRKKTIHRPLAIAMENKEGCMLSAGKSMLLFNNIDPLDKMADRINSITNEEIIEVANEIFGDNISILTYK